MNEERPPSQGGGFAGGFVAGLLVGAFIAYFALQEEARDLLVGKIREAGNYAADATGDLRANAGEIYARGKTVVDNARANVGAAVDEGHAAADKLRDDLSQHQQP